MRCASSRGGKKPPTDGGPIPQSSQFSPSCAQGPPLFRLASCVGAIQRQRWGTGNILLAKVSRTARCLLPFLLLVATPIHAQERLVPPLPIPHVGWYRRSWSGCVIAATAATAPRAHRKITRTRFTKQGAGPDKRLMTRFTEQGLV